MKSRISLKRTIDVVRSHVPFGNKLRLDPNQVTAEAFKLLIQSMGEEDLRKALSGITSIKFKQTVDLMTADYMNGMKVQQSDKTGFNVVYFNTGICYWVSEIPKGFAGDLESLDILAVGGWSNSSSCQKVIYFTEIVIYNQQ